MDYSIDFKLNFLDAFVHAGIDSSEDLQIRALATMYDLSDTLSNRVDDEGILFLSQTPIKELPILTSAQLGDETVASFCRDIWAWRNNGATVTSEQWGRYGGTLARTLAQRALNLRPLHMVWDGDNKVVTSIPV